MGLVAGEELTLEELLYGLLLNSGNDAAVAIAEMIAGTEAAFVRLMNAEAQRLGLRNTQYQNSHGLDAEGHYTTARDLATLARYAFKNKRLVQIAGTLRHTIPATEKHLRHELRNTNRALWWYPGLEGLKPGWTDEAGFVQVLFAHRYGKQLLAVIMGTDDWWGPARNLLDWGFAQLGAPLPSPPSLTPLLERTWAGFKQRYLLPDGRVQESPGATAQAQGLAMLMAVWAGDRPAFDLIATWTQRHLARDTAGISQDALHAAAWQEGVADAVPDWDTDSLADTYIAAAYLQAGKLWEEAAYLERGGQIARDLMRLCMVTRPGTFYPRYYLAPSVQAARETPALVPLATFQPLFFRLFSEATQEPRWLWAIDHGYDLLSTTTGPGTAFGSAGLPPALVMVGRDGALSLPAGAEAQQFDARTQRVLWHVALDGAWSTDPRPQAWALGRIGNFLSAHLTQRNPDRLVERYALDGAALSTRESPLTYGPVLAWAALASPHLTALVQEKLLATWRDLGSGDGLRADLSAVESAAAWLGLLTADGRAHNYWDGYRPRLPLPTDRQDYVVPPLDRSRWEFVHETGHTVSGPFYDAYKRLGVDILGYPRTPEREEDGKRVQYFQRARLELDPFTGTVTLAPLGSIISRPRAPFPTVAPFPARPEHRYFPQTGHSVHFAFLHFYDRHSGPEVFGYPISEEFVEDGRVVQYFERARFEFNPGAAPEYLVTLGLLGDEYLRQRGWLR